MHAETARQLAAIAIVVVLAASSAGRVAAVGDPLPDVDVSIGRKPGGIVQQIRTDAQGNFSSDVLPKGTYVITFHPRARTAAVPAPGTAGAAQAIPISGGGASSRISGVIPPGHGGDTRKSFFESRSNMRVTVSGSDAGLAMRTMPIASPQEMIVEAPGGQSIRGRIVE